jgi:glycosyltransferase involved in cell wall biosynthesis
MRILQLSTFDTRFGASIAARRLHEALLSSGQESDMLVSEVGSDSPRTHGAQLRLEKFKAKVRHHIDKLPFKLYPNRSSAQFSPNWVPSSLPRKVEALNPDVIHMHWCQTNFVPTTTLPHLGHPLIWTFHDMWAFTGGCHYSGGCERYLAQCGRCPILKSTHESDLSRWLWRQKRTVYRRLRKSLQIICPSNWMAELARNAPLLEGIPVHVVPNPISAQVFKPIDKIAARRLLGLPEKGHLLLMGATSRGDYRKGFDLLDAALQHYAGQAGAQPLGLVTLGTRNSGVSVKADGLRTWNIGFLQDEISLSALYSAVDIVALPSREENLSNMLSEALCCGTPCLAFGIGGNADLISHQINGFLASPGDTADMAAGLTWILNNLRDDKREAIARAAHDKVSYETLVPTFLKIYQTASARVS